MKKILLFTVFVIVISVANAQWQDTFEVSGNVYAITSDGTNIFAGTGSAGVSLSINDGDSWTAVNNGLTSTGINAIVIDGTNVFAGGEGIFLSTNNGEEWTAVNNGLTNTTINAMAISGTNIFAGTNGGAFLSTNNGELWTAANTGFDNQIAALACMGTNIFAGASNNGVYLSVNNGGLWTLVDNGLTNDDVHSLAISGTNIFAGTSGGVFLSSDNGTLWTAVNDGLTNLYINSLLVNGSDIFAGTNDGVFYSNNMGTSWTPINEGFSADALAWTLTINGDYIFAGMRLGPYGVWRRPLSEVISGIEENNDYSSFDLYPSPACDIVNLNIENENSEDLRVNIFNVTGTLVKSEIINQNQEFCVADLSEGIYMVEIKSKEWSKNKKMLIVR
jgi:hypothetical protein